VENAAQKVNPLIFKSVQSKPSPKRRKIAQSGHPVHYAMRCHAPTAV
jgi:hypothetical protein